MQIVCIGIGAYISGLNEIGDIAAYHEDNVGLTGKGYAGFDIIKVASIVKSEYEAIVLTKKPDLSRAFCTDAKQNTWTRTRPEEKEVWKNVSGKWCDLIARPHYAMTLDITAQDKLDLANSGVLKSAKLAILTTQIKEKISLNAENLIEVNDLNA